MLNRTAGQPISPSVGFSVVMTPGLPLIYQTMKKCLTDNYNLLCSIHGRRTAGRFQKGNTHMASMFASAKKLAAPKAKKTDKIQIELPGIADLAAVDALIKQLTAVKATLDADVKSQMTIEFIRMGAATKVRPENFEGTDGLASASCELRARASTSPLSNADAAMLEEAGIPVETIETTVDAFILNPQFTNDADVLGKMERALKKVAGLPVDLFLKQEGVSKKIVGKSAIDTLFASGDIEKIAKLLPHVSVPAIKPKLDAAANAFEIVRNMLGLGVKEDEKEDA